jgi:PAS domain S-box-containing protein
LPTQDQYIFQHNEHFELVLQSLDAGVYELDLEKKTFWWSSKFYELLGYKRGEISPNKQQFINTFVFPEDQNKLTAIFESYPKIAQHFIIEIRLLHHNGKYRWYQIAGQAKSRSHGSRPCLIGSLRDIQSRVEQQEQNKKNELFLEEIGVMAKVGGFEIKLNPFSSTWSKEMSIIHELPENYIPDYEEAISYVKPEYLPIVKKSINDALTLGIPYDIESKIITAKGREVWIRAIGKPVYDEKEEKIIALRGFFQDIDIQKEKELAFKASVNLINEQNHRLMNFSHIVSHNLRSHATNLALTLNLLEMETDPDELAHLGENLRKISNSFNKTMEYLNEIIVIQTKTNITRKSLKFKEVTKRIVASLKAEIEQIGVEIHYDFEACPEIDYIPAYLESILLNLISNGIKYRRADVTPVILIKTYTLNERIVLEVSDNGLGLDLVKHGDKLFGMHKTFHNNPNAKGIGLFITKNQIEALGGKISVKSEVNQGSTFTVVF